MVGDIGVVEVLDEGAYRVTGVITGDHEISWDLTHVAEAAPWLGGEREKVGLLPLGEDELARPHAGRAGESTRPGPGWARPPGPSSHPDPPRR
jgi:hypothetical protein